MEEEKSKISELKNRKKKYTYYIHRTQKAFVIIWITISKV